jgi:hypothetical protein
VAAVMLVWAGWKARAELRRASRIEAIREEAKEAALDEMSDGAGDPG